MKKLLSWTCSLLAVAFTYSAVLAADTVSPAEASQFIGQKATVYGTVASATFASRTKGQPTFLTLTRRTRDRSSRSSYGAVTGAFSIMPPKYFTGARRYALPAW